MTGKMKWIGFLGTLMLFLVIPVYAFKEGSQQEIRRLELQAEAVTRSTDLYAENCAVCHGASGEGIADMPALATDAIRLADEVDVFRVIARGRENTAMAAWMLEEGGILTDAQVKDMTAFLQAASWDLVADRVAALGLTPPEAVQMDVSEDMLLAVSSLPEGKAMVEGLMIYAENCAACHGPDGSGTSLAPAIDSPDLRASGADEILHTISFGVSGSLMSSWSNALSQEQMAQVTDLILRWPELLESGVEFPAAQVMEIEITPESIAEGQRLFSVACQACHGLDGYGSPMAPALNNLTFLQETPDAAIAQIIMGGVPDSLMPAWGNRLTETDVNVLVAYLRSLESSAPPMAP